MQRVLSIPRMLGRQISRDRAALLPFREIMVVLFFGNCAITTADA